MRTDTVTSSVTTEQVSEAEKQRVSYLESLSALQRLIATYETYGLWHPLRPDYSPNANRQATFKRSA